MTDSPFELRDGNVLYNNILIGAYEPGGTLNPALADGTSDLRDRVVLNLGWARRAGLRVVIEADPSIDRKRSGLVLDR